MAWLANFQRLQRKYMRHSLSIFSTSRTALRVQALLFIRHMANLIPDPAMDQALKVSMLSPLSCNKSLKESLHVCRPQNLVINFD